MTNPMRSSIALLSFAVCSALLPAQPVAPTIQSGPTTISLDVVVTPKSGKPVAGLHQQDFTVLDNNIARPIASFAALGGPQAPSEIILLVDAVNTGSIHLAYERQQIDSFLRSNGGVLAHPISLVIFTDTGTTMQTASTDGNHLADSLDQSNIGLRNIHNSSQHQGEDRLDLSLNTLNSLIAKESTRPGRKLVFWISPGWPLLSGTNIQLSTKLKQQVYAQVVAISSSLERSNITIYSVSPLGAGQSVGSEFDYLQFTKAVTQVDQIRIGYLSLQALAFQSGGLPLSGSNDIANQIEKCMADTEAWYHITYDPLPADQPNEYHRIEVKLSTPGFTARTRTGYYAQP
jgi:VWFA-related protein